MKKLVDLFRQMFSHRDIDYDVLLELMSLACTVSVSSNRNELLSSGFFDFLVDTIRNNGPPSKAPQYFYSSVRWVVWPGVTFSLHSANRLLTNLMEHAPDETLSNGHVGHYLASLFDIATPSMLESESVTLGVLYFANVSRTQFLLHFNQAAQHPLLGPQMLEALNPTRVANGLDFQLSVFNRSLKQLFCTCLAGGPGPMAPPPGAGQPCYPARSDLDVIFTCRQVTLRYLESGSVASWLLYFVSTAPMIASSRITAVHSRMLASPTPKWLTNSHWTEG